MTFTKDRSLDWNAINNRQKSPNQPDTSSNEQKFDLQTCIDAINSYSNLYRTNMVNICTIRGYERYGKSCSIQYTLLHALSKGLFALPSAQMSRHFFFIFIKKIYWLFALPFEKRLYCTSNRWRCNGKTSSVTRKMNTLYTVDVLFIYEIGQVPAELLSIVEIILKRVMDSQLFLEGWLILSTMYHMQLEPVCGRPFLLYFHVITCSKMVKLYTSIRCTSGAHFEWLQHILKLRYSLCTKDLIRELRQLLIDVSAYVNSWSSP